MMAETRVALNRVLRELRRKSMLWSWFSIHFGDAGHDVRGNANRGGLMRVSGEVTSPEPV